MREVHRFEGHSSVVSRVAISADGSRLLSTSSGYSEKGDERDWSVRVWDSSGNELRRLDPPKRTHSLAISPDGQQALTGHMGLVLLWDLDNGEILQRMSLEPCEPGGFSSVGSLVFSPDGRQALAGVWDGSVRLLDLTTGQELKLLKAVKEVMSVGFSSDGLRGGAGSGHGWYDHSGGDLDNFVMVWDLNTGQEMCRFPTGRNTATCVAFSPDGKQLLAGSDRYPSFIRLWDLDSGQEKVKRENNELRDIYAVTFSPIGSKALAFIAHISDKRVGDCRQVFPALFDVNSGREIARAETAPGPLECAAFSLSGRYAVSGDRDKVMCLWELPF